MLNTRRFGLELKKYGFEFFSGVPCSLLNSLINYAINHCTYVAAANEGDAVAIAAGAYLGGRKSVVLMQNSGLTNASSPLVSLNYPFRIPVLGFVSLRGEPGVADEPQHELMGRITTQMLDMMQIQWAFLSNDFDEAQEQLVEAALVIDRNQTFFFVVRRGTFDPEPLQERPQPLSTNLEQVRKSRPDELPVRYDVLQVINSLKDRHTVHLATTGKTGRELYEIEDADNNLYVVGSMGCVSSLGLGLALTRRDRKIVVIDGDGSLLMRMGNLATTGFYSPPNLLHILLDNHVHDSTGGQATVAQNMSFIDIAAACGYARACYLHNLVELKDCIGQWKQFPQLTFVYMKIAKGSRETLGRPRQKPFEIKERLQVFLHD